VQFFGGEARKTLLQVEPHLVTKTTDGTGTGTVVFLGTIVHYMLQEIKVLLHTSNFIEKGITSGRANGFLSTLVLTPKPYIRFVLNSQAIYFNIRPAVETDLEAITAIYNQAIALGYVTADTQPVDLASRREMWVTITQKQNRPFWVAEYQGKILAFFYFRNFYDRPAYRITAEIGIYIEKDEQGRGLGKQILEYCLQQAHGIGIENILALIFGSNKASIQLFEQYGFEKKGDFPKLARKGDDYNDLFIFYRRLS